MGKVRRPVVNSDARIAALFVETGGCYFGIDNVDPWDEPSDARNYAGPHPVVAHPPCARWGRYWGGAPTTWPRLKLGDDGGCFEAALAAVRRFGGVIEHPEGSHAWRHFGLNKPPRSGGWVNADFDGGWTCCVEQGAYGHKARKATWLYAFGTECPNLRWGRAEGDFIRFEDSYHSAEERAQARKRAVKTGMAQRLSKRQRAATPPEFRDLLISIARTAAPNTIGARSPYGGEATARRAGPGGQVVARLRIPLNLYPLDDLFQQNAEPYQAVSVIPNFRPFVSVSRLLHDHQHGENRCTNQYGRTEL